ncbi:glycosyltransferase [Campylobacter jejuni]|uniref:glycosyltransferase n=1 Tax=Campylobacter jejuni TaxID=197 RepID=UPI0012CC4895|nr:glycosyltransferase [Campylobacter jejuni]ECQ7164294.1 glycosyltransferase [Campylobacter jejuni]ECR1612501.1 glycosyltransferase [Campylobacter jejuni]ECR2169595.1 glycosyltransferase [Campylobacter jejuni]EDP4537292.1 glycosyltransferase [Campylobacter jejuni]HEF7823842.1 glycosyltransferase [Campylobacter jejuni]
MNNVPYISVVMPTYNREKYVAEAIESILNQSFTNFEFIIIDDGSSDNTCKIIEEFAKRDCRIIFLKNTCNKGIVYTLNRGIKLSKGKYIARMDDDDTSVFNRFQKQIEYLDKNEDIVVLGSYVESSDENGIKHPTWVDVDSANLVEVMLNFKCPISHPNVIIRKDFLFQNNIYYRKEYQYAEDYGLWMEIIFNGGKIENYPEILLKHRVTKNSITRNKKTNQIQSDVVQKIRRQFLERFFDKNETQKIIDNIKVYPFVANKISYIYEVIRKMQLIDKKNQDKYNEFINYFCGKESTMHIFFSSNNNYAQHLCVAIASILKNSSRLDNFYFYILDGGIDEGNKKKILYLRTIKDFEIEFIKIDKGLFKECLLSVECPHITQEAYFRFIIPKIKPELDRCIYLDCDVIVEDSLNLLWNMDFENNYILAVEEFWRDGRRYYKNNFSLNDCFNSGVMMINITKWKKNNIVSQLFFKTKIVNLQNKLKWVDQDILNLVFQNKWKKISPRYNAQSPIVSYDQLDFLSFQEELIYARYFPVIIHYTGVKPWDENCSHPMADKYFKYLQLTPYGNVLTPISLNKSPFSASDIVKNHLSYKLGHTMVKAKKPKDIIALPFRLLKITIEHKINRKIYENMILINPNFKIPNIEECNDCKEALKIRQYLSYRLGNALIKNPITFVFKIFIIYKNWKKEKDS